MERQKSSFVYFCSLYTVQSVHTFACMKDPDDVLRLSKCATNTAICHVLFALGLFRTRFLSSVKDKGDAASYRLTYYFFEKLLDSTKQPWFVRGAVVYRRDVLNKLSAQLDGLITRSKQPDRCKGSLAPLSEHLKKSQNRRVHLPWLRYSNCTRDTAEIVQGVCMHAVQSVHVFAYMKDLDDILCLSKCATNLFVMFYLPSGCSTVIAYCILHCFISCMEVLHIVPHTTWYRTECSASRTQPRSVKLIRFRWNQEGQSDCGLCPDD